MAVKFVRMEKYDETQWMQGNRTKDNSYFVCEFREDRHKFSEAADGSIDSGMYCKKFDKRLESKDDCDINCPVYGHCNVCRGFSAVGCGVCEIPRPGLKYED